MPALPLTIFSTPQYHSYTVSLIHPEKNSFTPCLCALSACNIPPIAILSYPIAYPILSLSSAAAPLVLPSPKVLVPVTVTLRCVQGQLMTCSGALQYLPPRKLQQ